MIHRLPNITYSVNDALDYYRKLQNDFEHLHWYYTRDHNDPGVIDPKNSLETMHGWGLQTVYKDANFPYHCDLDPHNEGPEFFKDTELVFGFGEKVLRFFDRPFRSFLMVSPPATHINKWKPSPPVHNKIVLPIITNDQSFIISHDTPVTRVLAVPGEMLMIDTSVYSEVINTGSTDFVAIVFNAPIDTVDKILETKGTI